ncbi:MAG: PH domain-containing protein, partial [Candidatus Aenigmatarchaeota archaeon]
MNRKVYKPDYIKGFFVSLEIVFYLFILFVLVINYIKLIFATMPFFIIFAIIFIIFSYLRLKIQLYELREDGIFIKKGVILKKEIFIPYSEVQDVYELQMFLHRLIGVKYLKIVTLSKLKSVWLECLKKEDAEEIKDFIFILSKTKEKTKKIEGFTLKKYEIHPIKKKLFIFLLLISFLIIPIFSIFLNFTNLIIPAAVTSFLFFYLFINSIIEKISFRLTLTEDFVSVGRVFISGKIINLPYEKIQDVTILRGPLDRLLNMAEIIIETGEGLVYVRSRRREQIILNKISNLYYRDAIEIKEFILRKAGIKNLETKSLREEFPLEKRKILKKGIKKTILDFIVLFFITYFIAKFLGISLLIYLPILSFIFFLFELFYEFLYFKSYHYSDNEEILCLRKGVFR